MNFGAGRLKDADILLYFFSRRKAGYISDGVTGGGGGGGGGANFCRVTLSSLTTILFDLETSNLACSISR